MHATARVFLAAAVSSLCLFSQSETGKSALEGRIFDPTGKAVDSVKITVVASQTGLRRQTITNADGAFRLTALPVGTYSVEALAPGFSPAKAANIELLVGETKSLSLSLSLESVTTQVNVEANAEIVNRSDINNSTTIGQRQIHDLPIRGRNFVEFIQLTPNVMQEGNRYGIVVNGQRSINSNISVDGVDFNDSLQGGQRGGGPNESAYFFPQLAVREFQVVRDGASAEVGRTNAGYVNVVTRSGSNDLHGEGFYANRNGSLTSPDAFGNDSSANAQNQLGGALGGPIRKEKLFFFGAVEKNLVTIPYTVKFNTPTGNVTIPQDILSQQGSFNQKNNPLVAFGRLDYILSANTTVNLQYTYAAQYGLNFGGQSGQTSSAATNNTNLNRASQGVKAGLTTVFSANLVNELRGQSVYDNRTEQPVSDLAQININDLGVIGGNNQGTYIYNATRNEILNNLSWTRGRHAIKLGFDLNFNPQQQQRETNYGGDYIFNTLADYLAARAGDRSKISRYQQTIAANGKQGFYDEMQQDHSFYITDTFRVRRDLSVTAGIRWDGQVNPQPPANAAFPINGQIPSDLKMWQPRLGLVWDIGGRGKTVLRASAGMFDSRTPGYLMQRVFTDNGFNTVVLDSSVDAKILNFLTIPQRLTSVPAGIAIAGNNAIYAFDPSFRNPRSGQFALAVEREISRSTRITIGMVRNATWSLQRRLDVNLYQPTVLSNGFVAYPVPDANGNPVQASGYNEATGQGIYLDAAGKALKIAVVRPDTRAGSINVNKSVGHSSYTSGYLSIQRRMSRRVQFAFNYTYAKSRDDDSNERDFNRQYMLNIYNLKSDAAYAKNDMRHSGNVNLLYNLGRGFTFSTLMIAHSGTPGRYVLGTDLNNDGNKNNDRPIINGYLVSRDSTRYPNFFDWDMRLLKEFKLGERARLLFSAEGYNLTAATNKTFNGDGDSLFGKPQAAVNPATGFKYVNSAAGIPTFAPGTDRFGGPRQGQLGLRLTF